MKQALFVAWRTQDPDNPAWGPIGRLEYENGTYRFFYTEGARTLPGFYPFFRMEDLDIVYESDELPPLFSNRLLSKSRPEYEAYLSWSGFDYKNPPGPIQLLAVTQGQRQTDAIEVFPCPVPDEGGCYLNRFFIHGIRYSDDAGKAYVKRMKAEEQLRLVPEPENPVDPQAVAIYPMNDDMRLGYAPRYLAHDILHLEGNCNVVELFVQRINSDAPLQQRVLCRMNACWPPGFEPCQSEAFQPIPKGVSANCEA
ncbi:MAG: HIRAN domain-containing protein [Planctomycetaceae bacterium]|nr:HIRAN domain-containing protein [Planctomycetaceae bacterium]